MVVGRSQAGEQNPGEKEGIGHELGLFDESLSFLQLVLAPNKSQSQGTDQQKRQIGNDIKKIGDAQEHTAIGKIVIFGILGHGWQKQGDHQKSQGQAGDDEQTGRPFHCVSCTLREGSIGAH